VLVRLIPDRISQIVFSSFGAKDTFFYQVDELRQQHPHTPIAFAVFAGGFMELWALRTFLREHLGPEFDLRIATRSPGFLTESFETLYRRIASIFRLSHRPRSRIRQCTDELLAGRPVLLNFEGTDRRKAFEVPTGERELGYIAQRVPQCLIIPVAVVWRRKRPVRNHEISTEAKVFKAVFSPLVFLKVLLLGDPDRPTNLGKFLALLRRYERSVFRVCEPIPIYETSVRITRRKVLNLIFQEKRVILGPAIAPPRYISDGILRHPTFLKVVESVSENEGIPQKVLLRKASSYFQEMAADFSYFIVEGFAWVLSWVFSRIFEDLTTDEEQFEKLRLTSREGPLLLIPSHKSYFDFLVLSYVFFKKELAPPHVAAGINLNFWPFGIFAKKSGAFFIRRSFRGNVIYTEILKRYVAALLQNRLNVEFFIEGMRSRNGKLAPPKYGLLKMIADSIQEDLITEKIRVVPVSISYDRVTEVKAHKRELEGGEKVGESFVGLAKSSSILFKKFGKVHVRLADPIPMNEWIDRDTGHSLESPDIIRLSVQKLAFEICHRINRSTPVSGTGIAAAILLLKKSCSMSLEEFIAFGRIFEKDILYSGYFLSHELNQNFERGLRRGLSGLIDDGIVEKFSLSTRGVGIRIPVKQRVAALYYKNSVIHACLMACVSGFKEGSVEDLLELRSLLQFEFFFSEKEVFLNHLSHFPENISSDLYSRLIEDVLETIQLGLELLGNVGTDVEFDTKEWRSRLMKFGKAAIMEYRVERLESVNTQGFSAFLELAKNKKWLVRGSKESNLRVGNERQIHSALQTVLKFKSRIRPWDEIEKKYHPHPNTR
jgi:1-acyl-sn-glycerol-3-phosphate acyltransferase